MAGIISQHTKLNQSSMESPSSSSRRSLHKYSIVLLLLLGLFIFLQQFHFQPITTFPKQAHPTKSGYLTVNSTTNSSIFYTFYESQQQTNNNNNTPIIIWLQGGPGCSSMIANFYELGPFKVTQNLTLVKNLASWNKIFGLLFLDNPIGTGFSIAKSNEEIPTNQHDVARHLYIAIKKFVSSDVEFAKRPIFITGESYAGKYVPSLAYYILRKNELVGVNESRVNLAGVAIGNGLTDPVTQVETHAVNAFNLGLINEKERVVLEEIQSEAVRFVKSWNWSEATNARTRVLRTLENMTGLATLYDFRRLSPYKDELVASFLNNVEVKKVLGVNESMVFELCSDLVREVLHDDVMKSVKYMVELLVKNTRVLLYQGQCDLRDGVVSTLAWMKKMKWDGIGKFLEAERKVWRVDGSLAGYVQRWENLSHVVVMNAGHLVPTDQPKNSQVMIEDWVLEKGLFAGEKKSSL